VLAVGELCPDFILSGVKASLPVLGTEQEIGSYRLVLGSATALCAVALTRLGLRTAMVARIGEDDYGRFCVGRLREEGVDVADIVVDADLPTGLTVAVAYPADRLLLTLPGTMKVWTTADIPLARLQEARHLHVSSFFLQEGLQRGLPALFDAAHARGMTTSLDTGWDPREVWMTELLREVFARVDVFLPNESELTALGGSTDVNKAAAALLTTGVGRVAVKQGADGATFYDRHTEVSAPGFTVEAVDTTGAGDNFNGGFLFGTLSGWPVERCLRLGNACGALSVRVAGGIGGYASLGEVEAFMTSRHAG